jgi:hypothetical protein
MHQQAGSYRVAIIQTFEYRATLAMSTGRFAGEEAFMTRFLLLLALSTAGIFGVSTILKAEGTPEQRWACEQDAFKFCGKEIPNVQRVTVCMTKNVKKLSPACRSQFK